MQLTRLDEIEKNMTEIGEILKAQNNILTMHSEVIQDMPNILANIFKRLDTIESALIMHNMVELVDENDDEDYDSDTDDLGIDIDELE